MNDNDRALCAATAGLLRASSAAAAWGLALSCIAGLVLALTGRSLPTAAWFTTAAVALIGLVERYLALRLRLEATLFEGLATNGIASLETLDTALAQLALRGRAAEPRTLVERAAGARQMTQRHGLAVALQTAVFAMALAVQDWR